MIILRILANIFEDEVSEVLDVLWELILYLQ
jgi:hypothetical protein